MRHFGYRRWPAQPWAIFGFGALRAHSAPTTVAFGTGFATSGAFSVAIGAPNALVLRQGIKREHVLAVVLVCAVSNALLITLGVAGLGTLVQRSPALLTVIRYGGAAFLIGYGLLAAQRALHD